MNAIILAGETKRDYEYFGCGKALIDLKGQPLIHYIIYGLKQSEMVEKILVVGNKGRLEPIIGDQVDKILEQKEDMLSNLFQGISYFEEDPNVLVSTCDLPFIHGQAIKHFIEEGLRQDVDLCYPIVERKVCQHKYPEARRTYAHLKDGCYTGGNIMLLNPSKLKTIEKETRLLIKYRKNPIKMTRVLGFSLIFRMLLRNLTIEDLEKYIEKRFGIRGRALISPYPEISSDIDLKEDIKTLIQYM